MAEKVTVTGRISRVETKFAYINTSRGSVFCPLAAAIPPTDNVPNFSIRYGVGDLVHVTMVPQDGKNGCYWRAVKVRRVNKVKDTTTVRSAVAHATPGTNEPKNDVITNKSAIITNVSETLAYGHSDKLGSIFIPGAAFSSEEVTRLNSYLNLGDEVIVSIRPQTDVNGCKWIAVSATKKKKSKQPHITGSGKIVELKKCSASVWCPNNGQIQCSILCWTGGDGGKNAKFLTDILNIGDTVLFTATKRDGEQHWKAVKWTASGFRIGEERVQLADSYTQTAISTSEITQRYVASTLGELLAEKATLKCILG